MDSCTQSPIFWGRSSYQYHGKNLGTGNRCGHNPNSPNFDLFNPPKKSGMSHTVRDLIGGVEKYFKSPKLLPTLSNLTGKKNADGALRSNRSEAREAESLVLAAILHSTDWSSMRIGTPKPDGEFVPRDGVYLATIAGLAKRETDSEGREVWEPTTRFWRALARLRKAGAIDVFNVYVIKPDGSKRARPSVKTLNVDFLVSMGVASYAKMKKLRDWASDKVTKARKAYERKYPAAKDAQRARNSLGLKNASANHGPAKSKPRPPLAGDNAHSEAYNRARIAYQKRLLIEDGLDLRAARSKLEREFPTFDRWKADNIKE